MSTEPPVSGRPELRAGAVLLAATVLALVWASSPWSGGYSDLWSTSLLGTDVRHVVDDGAMSLFFLVLGLELKHETTDGRLSTRSALAIPVIGALGGMLLPAAVFLALNAGGDTARGWGIPMATDVAFCLAVLATVRGVPAGVRALLLALAVVDDVGAIVVIAVAYPDDVQPLWLLAAGAGLGGIALLRRAGLAGWPLYALVGLGTWAATAASGVHPTIAAVALGLLVPAGPLLGRWQARLEPWTTYLVLPLFALANAGVAVSASALGDALTSRLGLGIVLGLVAGKVVGIAGAIGLARRLGLGRLPDGVDGHHVVGLGALAGIGFTVCLFVTGLAFDDAEHLRTATLAVLLASVAAALLGRGLLGRSPRPRRAVR